MKILSIYDRNRRWLGWAIAFLITLSITIGLIRTPFAFSQTKLGDIQGHWAQACIENLAQKQIISGYPDGTFKPSATVTRAEFAAMVRRAFPNATAIRTAGKFIDVPTNYWAGDAIRQAYQAGFMSGYPGQIFNPTQKIARGQVLVSLANGLKYTPSANSTDINNLLNLAFIDALNIAEYAKSAIVAAIERQLVVNYPNVRSLNPNQLATRADVATSLCQAMGLTGLVPNQYIASLGSISAPTSEIRGVWLTNVDSDVLFSKDKLTNGLQRLKNLNFNTVYPTVWNEGYTLYPSPVAEKISGRSLDPTPGLQGRDMLKEVVEQGHQKGLTVIPWVEFGFMAPADSELAKRHPDWLTQRRDGSTIWKEGTHERVWLNPFHPEVQEFILNLTTEIVSKYDVDGIQFDDHFGLPAEFGYDPFTIALYQKQNPGLSPSNDFRETYWIRWRADRINDFMGRVFQAVKAIKPKCLISISPNPLHFSLPAFLQDWFTWERRGYAEELILQVYRNDLNRFITELDRSEVRLAKSHIPVAIGILSGLKGNSPPTSQIQTQVETVRRRGFAGVSFFFYESLWNWAKETPAERESVLKKLFPNSASRPNLLEGNG